MNKLKDNTFLKKILLVFLIVQPILDCYLLYTDEIINFFHFSPTTIIRMLIIALLFLLVFFNKNNKENKKYIFIYGGLILIYSILHHFVSSGFDNSEYKIFNYTIITELFYIIRMLLPIGIIFITYNLKLTKKEFITLFLTVSFIASFIIIILNIFNIALASYGGGKVKGNILDWFFNKDYTPRDLASKGWFNSANQISGLMFILFPICIYSIFEKPTKYRIIITCMVLLSMIMLGTRVASYGWILIAIMMFVLYLFFIFIVKNKKFEIKKFMAVLFIFVGGLIVMIWAPIVNTGDGFEVDDKKIQSLKEENASIKDMLGYVGVDTLYYNEVYPYNEHKEFWRYVVEDVPATKRVGNRNAQTLITYDVGKTYENFPRSLFGLGYSRFINAYLYLEKDFVVHFYTIGILGIILLLLPYVLIAVYGLFKYVKNKKFDLFTATILAMLVLPLGVSYFSGHIVDELIISLYLGFIGGYILCECKEASEYGQG